MPKDSNKEEPMFLPTHACLANLFSSARRRAWLPAEHRSFWIGAIFPDLPAVIPGCWEFVKYCRWFILGSDETEPLQDVLWTNTGYYRHCILAREVLHNVWFWTAVLILAACFKHRPLVAKVVRPLAWGALIFHIGMDWPTHVLPVHNYLWPLTKHALVGFTSHAAVGLSVLEAAICLVWIRVRFAPGRKAPHTVLFPSLGDIT